MKFIANKILLAAIFLPFLSNFSAHAVNSNATLTPLSIPKDMLNEWNIDISPDGTKLVYEEQSLSTEQPIRQVHRLVVRSITADDFSAPSEPQVLIEEPSRLWARYYQPTWSPDGNWIAFYRREDLPARYAKRKLSDFWRPQSPIKLEKPDGVYMISAAGDRMRFLAPADLDVSKGGELLLLPSGLSWSPDGRSLAYVSWEGKHSDIYIVSLETGQVEPFTVDHKDNMYPAWVPDGKQIAFQSTRGRGGWLGAVSTWVKPVNGGEPISMGRSVILPVWSPNGKMVTYVDRAPNTTNGIVVTRVDADGRTFGTPVLLREGNYVGSAIKRWTADGKILFLETTSGRSLLYMTTTADGGHHLIADDLNLNFAKISWLPDGERLFLPHGEDGRAGFLNLNTGKFTQLQLDLLPEAANHVSISPNGNMMAFSVSDSQNLETITELSTFKENHLCISSVSNSKLIRLTTSKFPLVGLCWSPDGNRIAFAKLETLKTKKVRSTLCVLSLSNREVKELAESEYFTECAWSPDGTVLAYVKGYSYTSAYKGDLFVMPAAGGESKQITNSAGREENLSWAPDGQTIAFDLHGRTQLIPIKGGEPILVTQEDVYTAIPNGWSADSRYLLALKAIRIGDELRSQLVQVSVGDGSPIEIPVQLPPRIHPISMLPNGRILYLETVAEPQTRCWLMDVQDLKEDASFLAPSKVER